MWIVELVGTIFYWLVTLRFSSIYLLLTGRPERAVVSSWYTWR